MPISKNYRLRALDVTYMLFLIAGSVAGLIFTVIASDPQNAEGWGMLLGLTVGLVGIAALVGGTVRTFWFWRHRPLLFLSLSPIAIVAGVAVSEFVANVTLAVWVFSTIFVPVWWFAKGRQPYQKQFPRAEA